MRICDSLQVGVQVDMPCLEQDDDGVFSLRLLIFPSPAPPSLSFSISYLHILTILLVPTSMPSTRKTIKKMSNSLIRSKKSTRFLDPLFGSPLCSPTERWRNFVDRTEGTDDDDMISILTMETIDDNMGAGRTLFKYFFRPAGLSLERLLNKILGPALATPFAIGCQLQHFIQYDFQWPMVPYPFRNPLRTIVWSLEQKCGGRGTVSGLKRLFRLCR